MLNKLDFPASVSFIRVYGEFPPDTPNDISSEQSMNGHNMPINKDKVVQLLENQVADLKGQLEKSEERVDALIKEKTRLVDMYNEERAERRALVPPPAHEKRSGWWSKLTGRT